MPFFALSSTAGYLLSGLRQPSHPARIFSGILPDPFDLLPSRRLAFIRGMPAQVTLVTQILTYKPLKKVKIRNKGWPFFGPLC